MIAKIHRRFNVVDKMVHTWHIFKRIKIIPLHIARILVERSLNLMKTSAAVVSGCFEHLAPLDASTGFCTIDYLVALVSLHEKSICLRLVTRSVSTVAVATVAVTTATSFINDESRHLTDRPAIEKQTTLTKMPRQP